MIRTENWKGTAYMFAETGTIYSIVIIMFYVTVLLDYFNFFTVFIAKKVSKTDYCGASIKWIKIFLFAFFEVVLIYFTFTQPFSVYVRVIHIILAVILGADLVLNLVFKIKYGRNR